MALTQMDTQGKAGAAYVYLVAFGAAVGGFLFGYDLSVIGGAQLQLKEYFNLNEEQFGFAVGSAILGCIAGPLCAAYLADRFGRRPTLLIASILLGVSAIGTAFPSSIFEFNVYRIVGGVGVGLASVVSPMYIAEISPPARRGGLVTLNQFAIVIGAFVALVLGYYLTIKLPDTVNWRWMFGLEVVPVIGFIAYLGIVPESPRWLAQVGKDEQAERVLTKFLGAGIARAELTAIKGSLNQESGRLSELAQPGMRKALWVGVNLAVLQQWCGVSILAFYMPTIYKMAGAKQTEDAVLSAVYTQGFEFLIVLLAFWLVDRIGRRPLLLFGSAGMAAGLFAMGCAFYMGLQGSYILWIMIACKLFYCISLAPLAWLVMAEIFPTRIRSRAMGLCALALWLSCFAGVYAFPQVNQFFETKTGSAAGSFWLFSAVCCYAFVFCWFTVKETKGKTLEEIGAGWGK